ncbi:MAG: hypothetical protein NE334_15440 [Lentisphaeraceae bacterium]|nr:hypothetical protein [Lentisphaeraceae bacterium]
MNIIKNLILITILSFAPNLLAQDTGKPITENTQVQELSNEQQNLADQEKGKKQKNLKYVFLAFFLLAIYRVHLFIKAKKRKKEQKAMRESRKL